MDLGREDAGVHKTADFGKNFTVGPEGLSVFIAKGTKHVFKPLKQEAELYIPACLFQSSCHLDF